MRIGAETPIGNIDGFRVDAPGGRVGWVEELWLDDEGGTTAAVVRLPGARRGLLVHDDIDGILFEERAIAVRPDARLLELDPPHLDARAHGALEASWGTSGKALTLPQLLPAAPVARSTSRESSLLTSVVVLYAGLVVIAFALTGLCFLIPYLVVGRPF
jgi:hypothetical protein